MRLLENPQPKSLLDPNQPWVTSGLGPITSDGVNPVREIGARGTVGWTGVPGRYTLQGNVYARGCGQVEVMLGDQHLTVQDSPQDDDGYIQFTLSSWVARPAAGLQLTSTCPPNSTPILLYQGTLLQITPSAAPQWQTWGAAGLAVLILIGVSFLLRPWER